MLNKFSTVFKISAGIMLLLVILGVAWPEGLENITTNVQDFIAINLGWYYLIIVTFFVLVVLMFLITPLGKIKLGKPGEKPEFSRPSWIAMLFSAGMGIGLVFWGTAEPISHYAISSPTLETGTDQAIKDAMRFTYFHWGIHAWGIYGIVGLVLAYFNYRHDKPALISATLEPVIGDLAKGTSGKVIDIFAVIATVIGVATTLGFGAVQINGGLAYLFDIPNEFFIQLIIIVIVTVLFMISAWTGLGKGIKILSNVNMGLAGLLFLLIFIFGPTLFILNLFTDSLGSYLQHLPQMSFRIAPLNEESQEWIKSWTIFYWAWWIAWSPFVGIFIARISRGRSIREFVFIVLIIPSLVGFLWFATFGGTAIHLEHTGVAEISKLATEESLFGVLSNFPLGLVASIVAMLLISTFFITSADSGTFVLGLMTTGGIGDPGKMIKLTWGVLLSSIALALLYTGGLQALQNTMIIAALPFSVIMFFMCISFLKSIYKEGKELGVVNNKQKKN
ncbi:choline transporter [Salipaludibacillus neizhouensis]|uniref:Choline transporter n=1 Tax=Salipaludibacillus neizhouensis TaxID=885475 RepID=A0A3A9KIC5_9BACI|nr:BCCT family transporter [Salipaludibacillus neizhouensis]RKL64706.1 choline transporter [Salipaludibacillus neizhouensis]